MLIAMTKEQLDVCIEKGWVIKLENYISEDNMILKNNLSEAAYTELSVMFDGDYSTQNTIPVTTTTGLLEVYQYVLTFALTEGVGLKYITVNQGTVGEMDLKTYSAILEKLKNNYPAHDPALVNDFKMKIFEHKSSPMVSRGY